jgi:hypothetical protein
VTLWSAAQPSTTRLDVATSTEPTPPVATISSSVSNPTNFNPFTVSIEFSRPVENFSCDSMHCDLTVEGGYIFQNRIVNTDYGVWNMYYEVMVVPLTDGDVNVTLDAGVCQVRHTQNPRGRNDDVRTYPYACPLVIEPTCSVEAEKTP